jgi:hypothetical protein
MISFDDVVLESTQQHVTTQSKVCSANLLNELQLKGDDSGATKEAIT